MELIYSTFNLRLIINQRWIFLSELHANFAPKDKLKYEKQREDNSQPFYLYNGVMGVAKENEEYRSRIENIQNCQMNSQELEEVMTNAFNITGMYKLNNLCRNINTYSGAELDLPHLLNMHKIVKSSK